MSEKRRDREPGAWVEAVARPASIPVASRRYVLTIEGWSPASVNRLLTKHWAVAHKLKVEAKDAVAVGCLLAPDRPPKATMRRRVGILVVVSGRGRLPDPDNILKVLLDACVANRLLVDDSAKYLELGEIAVVRGLSRRTVVTLEDVE